MSPKVRNLPRLWLSTQPPNASVRCDRISYDAMIRVRRSNRHELEVIEWG